MKTFILGCGAQGRIILDILRDEGRYDNISFIDDNPSFWNTQINGAMVEGGKELLGKLDPSSFYLIIALGNSMVRQKLYSEFKTAGYQMINAIHPSAVIMPSVEMGIGNMICANAIVNTNAKVGNSTIINTAANIEHDCIIKDFVSISPGAQIGGRVTINELAFVGTGAIILARKIIGTNSIIAAGALVTKDVEPKTLVQGIPAKEVSKIDELFDWNRLF